jgi:hypothetical protein
MWRVLVAVAAAIIIVWAWPVASFHAGDGGARTPTRRIPPPPPHLGLERSAECVQQLEAACAVFNGMHYEELYRTADGIVNTANNDGTEWLPPHQGVEGLVPPTALSRRVDRRARRVPGTAHAMQ